MFLANSIRPLFSSASFERTRGFFRRLGFEVREGEGGLVVEADGAAIQYLEIPPPPGEPLPEPTHRNETCAIFVDDVFALHQRIRRSRQRFGMLVPPTYRGEPHAGAWPTPATAMTDPDGNLIWFVQRGIDPA